MNTSFERDVFDRRCIFCERILSACMGFVVPRLFQRLMKMRERLALSPDDIHVESCGNRNFIVRVEICGRCEVILTEVFKIRFEEDKENLEEGDDGEAILFRGEN